MDQQVAQALSEPRVGRPPVGPVVRAAIPPEVRDFILNQVRARRARTTAAVVRSLIIAGYEATRGNR
jgi:hypothetical protein